MKRLFAGLAAVLVAGALLSGGAPSARPAIRTAPMEVQPDIFFDQHEFHKGLGEVRTRQITGGDGLVGGVVPHHNLAGAMFSTFFVQLEADPPETLIVVGPNHEHQGQRVITGRRGWATPFGTVEADLPLVEALVKAGLATVDDGALEKEHAVGALMPYLMYHAPGARVLPIVLHRDVTMAQMEQLAKTLAPWLDGSRVLVASVDFSHYLKRAEAEAKDEVTWAAIQRFDLAALRRMGPDHIDSPGALGVLMLTMREIGAKGPSMEGHTNSGVLLNSDHIETTSYFVLTYRR